MDTLKAKPQIAELIVTSNPYVGFTPFGYQPFLNVKKIVDNQQYKINISPKSLGNELNKLFEENDIKVGSAVSKNTFMLIAKSLDEESTKITKAKELDIPINSLDEFKKSLGVQFKKLF